MSILKNKFSAEELYERTIRIERGDVAVEESDGYLATIRKNVNELTYMDLEQALITIRSQFYLLSRSYYEPWKRGNNGHESWQNLQKEISIILAKLKEVRPEFVRQRTERAKRSRDEQRVTRIEGGGAKIPMFRAWGSRNILLGDLGTDWLLAHPYFEKMAIKSRYIENPNVVTDIVVAEEQRRSGWLSRFTGWLNSAAEWTEDTVRSWLGWS